jgi:hypothetical protein
MSEKLDERMSEDEVRNFVGKGQLPAIVAARFGVPLSLALLRLEQLGLPTQPVEPDPLHGEDV